MRASVVIIEISFNIEKDKARFPIPNYDVIRFTGRDFFDDESVEGRLQRWRKSCGVFRYEPHRAERGITQYIVKHKNREKRIGSDSETHCVEFRCCGADSVNPVQIEIHRGASPLDNHLFQRSGLSSGAFFSGLRDRISRAIAEKQEQWEHEITRHFP